MIRSGGIQGGARYSRRRIFDKLLERMELCINNHGDYFEHLTKLRVDVKLKTVLMDFIIIFISALQFFLI